MQCRSQRRHGFAPWVRRIPWSRAWQPTPVFLPGNSHGQRSLEGYSPGGHKRVEYDLVIKQPTLSSHKEKGQVCSCLPFPLVFLPGMTTSSACLGLEGNGETSRGGKIFPSSGSGRMEGGHPFPRSLRQAQDWEGRAVVTLPGLSLLQEEQGVAGSVPTPLPPWLCQQLSTGRRVSSRGQAQGPQVTVECSDACWLNNRFQGHPQPARGPWVY